MKTLSTPKTGNPIRLFLAILLFLAVSGITLKVDSANAQRSSFWDDTDLVPFKKGGSVGLTASAYTANGIENRRAPGVLQTFANMNFSVLGLRSGLNINYSTDETGLRQNMNKLSYSANWKWLTFQAGDVNTRLSDYGLNGTTIRGGYIRAEPGSYIFEFVAGRSRRVVRPSFDTGFREPSFEQWAYGGKVGVGSTSGSFLHVSAFYARDNVASLEGDVIEIKPQENLSITPDFKVDFFGGRFSVESQVTVSAFTRDLKSSSLSSSDLDLPYFVTSIYQPRVSTRLNYAGHAAASFQSNPFDLMVGYERIQPGFISLGRGKIRNDQERINFSPTLRVFNNRLSIQSDVSFSRDNLLGTRLQTQSNTNVVTSMQMIFSESFNLATSYNLLLNDVDSEVIEGIEQSEGGQSQTSHNIMLQPNFIIMGEDFVHNISVAGGYLSVESNISGSSEMDRMSYLSESYTGVLTYAITFPTGFTINSSGNYLTNFSDAGEIQNVGINLGSSYALFDRELTISVNVGINQNRFEREIPSAPTMTNKLQQLTGSINTSYRLTDKDTFNLTIRSRNNRVMDGSGNEFTELEGSFRYQHTF
ncbi:hypothetical protein [Rhodohalobacter sp. 614A]|uniref:hypothetical protein n=1 Tax=Rhodohalobacter sp. 614A TaxID=2908649 RepID=UPI001F38001E|nr:hypothetical protein [Rhodohalobacter sp. 614A]